MSVNFSSSFDQTAYVGIGPNVSTFPNTSGTALLTGFKKLRFTTLTLNGDIELMDIEYKTGSRSPLVGAPGRGAGTWNVTLDIIPSGTAGTAPDCDAVLQMIFGHAPTVVASTSVTYTLNDAIVYGCFLLYDKTPGLTSPSNFFAFGCTATDISINYNGKFYTATVSGKCTFAANSTVFSSMTGNLVPGLGGLTTFPAEPSVTINGNSIASFGGTATFDSNAVTGLVGPFTVKNTSGVEMPNDDFTSLFATSAFGGLRRFMISGATFDNSDGTFLNNIKIKSVTKVQMPVVLALTPGVGSNVSAALNNVQWSSSGDYKDNGARRQVSFGDGMANQTTAGALDDFSLAFT